MKRLLCILLLGLTASTLAAAGGSPQTPRAAATPADKATQALPRPSGMTPVERLKMGVDSLIAFMSKEPVPAPSAIARFLDEQIAPMFDFDAMARAAAGRYYLRLSPRQQHAMAEEIKHLFLTRLTEGLAVYSGQQVRFLRPRLSPDGREAALGMLILHPGSYPARIDFRLAREQSGWRIIDLAANGSSAVVYYRRMLAATLARRAYRPGPPVPGYGMMPRW